MTMDDRDGLIWMDGEWVEWREAKVHVLTHTLHYGAGVFEGLRAYHAEKGTAIFKLPEHTDRLYRSAHILNMKIPFNKDEVNQAAALAFAGAIATIDLQFGEKLSKKTKGVVRAFESSRKNVIH